MSGWGLAVVSVVCGAGALWVFRRVADLAAVRGVRRQMAAHLLEFRLYGNEPRLIWRAQGELLVDNLRLLALLLRQVLILALPMAWLMIQLDTVYGLRPLAVGEAAVVTAQMAGPLAEGDGIYKMEAPAGIAVETAAVRDFADRQVSWRIRPERAVEGALRLGLDGQAVEKSIAAGSSSLLLSPRREGTLLAFLLHPEEAKLAAGGVRWVEINYPPADVRLAGIEMPWLAWFLAISLVSAAVSNHWMREPS